MDAIVGWSVHHCGLDYNISTIIRGVVNICGVQRMNPNDYMSHLTQE